jgi:hypothetical protein
MVMEAASGGLLLGANKKVGLQTTSLSHVTHERSTSGGIKVTVQLHGLDGTQSWGRYEVSAATIHCA